MELAYFPEIYPDELLYSVLARFHRHLGGTQPMQTMELLFGKRSVTASFDLPGHLSALAERLPSMRGLSIDQIIDTLTLCPYYTAFESRAVRGEARRAMRRGNVANLHLRLGLAAFREGRITTLRFCPECRAQMLAEHRELYWRRDQQLPTVIVCPVHGCSLAESTVSLTRTSRYLFIAARPENCPRNAIPLVSVSNATVLTCLQDLAKRSARLLQRPGAARTYEGWARVYRERLVEVGSASSSGWVGQSRLAREFLDFYGEALQYLPGLSTENPFPGDWLAAMTRKARHARKPLYHLLLQGFLTGRKRVESPFGRGPWRCLNPLATHRAKHPVTELHRHRNRGHVVGVFSCSCGYVYTRCFNPATGRLGPPRFQHYGPLLEAELRQLVAAGTSLRATAQTLRLDPKTVVSLARELDIPIVWQLRPSRKELVRRQATTAWSRTPNARIRKRRARRMGSSRRDWPALDAALVVKVMRAASEIRRIKPPVRVSIAEIERRTASRGWFGKRAYKLPCTWTRIARLVESTRDFQGRRILWAIAELERVGDRVCASYVLRKAGLKGHQLPRVEAILDARYAIGRRVA